jgi:hypothetical protein
MLDRAMVLVTFYGMWLLGILIIVVKQLIRSGR